MDIEKLLSVLKRNKIMSRLVLSSNQIGLRGCTSLGKLLKSQGFKPFWLNLSDNLINNVTATILADSLAKTLLHMIFYRNAEITTAGWLAILRRLFATARALKV